MAHLPTLYVPPTSDRLPDNEQWENRFEIRSASSDRLYVVAQHKTKRHWACSCPACGENWSQTRSPRSGT